MKIFFFCSKRVIFVLGCGTYINSRHRRVGHIGALQFEFRIQPKWHGESHVDGGTHVHETRAQIEENLLRNKRKYCEIDCLASVCRLSTLSTHKQRLSHQMECSIRNDVANEQQCWSQQTGRNGRQAAIEGLANVFCVRNAEPDEHRLAARAQNHFTQLQ